MRLSDVKLPLFLGTLFLSACIRHTDTAWSLQPANTPAAAFGTYLQAIEHNDLQAATAYSATRDKNETDFAGVMNAYFINSHRLHTLITAKFASKDLRSVTGMAALDNYSDAAIDRALGRIDHAMAIITGDTATITFYIDPSNKDDGPDLPVFKVSEDPVPMRNVNGEWKLDLAKLTDTKPDQLLAPGSLGSLVRLSAKMTNELCADLESGKIASIEQFNQVLETKNAALQGQFASELKHPDN